MGELLNRNAPIAPPRTGSLSKSPARMAYWVRGCSAKKTIESRKILFKYDKSLLRPHGPLNWVFRAFKSRRDWTRPPYHDLPRPLGDRGAAGRGRPMLSRIHVTKNGPPPSTGEVPVRNHRPCKSRLRGHGCEPRHLKGAPRSTRIPDLGNRVVTFRREP